MTLCNPQELRSLIPQGQRLLGLDIGDKTIGVAVCDPGWRLATAVETLPRRKLAADLAALQGLAKDRAIGGIVIGLPVGLDGKENSRCQSIRQFARSLEAAYPQTYAITFWDERMSTAAVERLMIEEADISRARRARVIDAHAAAYILQGALDALMNKETP
jgi:putative Holliday junction resolvase